MKREQRELLAHTLKDVANIAAGAMVFGQLLSDRRFSVWIALVGVGLWILVTTVAVKLIGRSGWTNE